MSEGWSRQEHVPMPERAPKAARASPVAAVAVVAALTAAGMALFHRAPPRASAPVQTPAAVETPSAAAPAPAVEKAAAPRVDLPAPAPSPAPAPASFESSAEGLAAAPTGESGTLSPVALPAPGPAGAAPAAGPWRKALDPLDTTSLYGNGETRSSAFIAGAGKPGAVAKPQGAGVEPAAHATRLSSSKRVADLFYRRSHEEFSVCACTVGDRVAGYAVDGKAMGSKFLGTEALRVGFDKAGGGFGSHTIVIDSKPGWPLRRYTITQDASGRVTSVAEYEDGSVAHENWNYGFTPCPGH